MQDDQNIVYLKVNHYDCSIFLYLAFHDEVLKDIKSFKHKSSSDQEGISKKMIKLSADLISYPIAALLNQMAIYGK